MGLETFYKRLRGDRPEITIVEADEIRQAWLSTFYDVALWQKLHASDFPPQGLRRDPSWPALVLVLARAWIRRRCPKTFPFRDDLLVGFSKPLCLNFPVQGSACRGDDARPRQHASGAQGLKREADRDRAR